MDPKPDGLSPRSTIRGRPRTTSARDDPCARCGRNIPRLAATWPDGRLCNICYFEAIHTRGTCPECLQDRLLPGPPNADDHPICWTCAEIPYDFHCERCDVEAGHHRGRLCARCALRDDLHGLLGGAPSDPALVGLVDALCASGRPESIIVWKRSPKVQDTAPRSRRRHHPGIARRSRHCPRQASRTPPCAAAASRPTPPPRPVSAPLRAMDRRQARRAAGRVRQPVQHFATWHHLRRIRAKAAAGASTRGPVHSAKQEITETVKFLVWLLETYQRTAATCTQQDADEWLATGPTTRTAIRTFFVVAKKSRLNTTVQLSGTDQPRPAHPSARTSGSPGSTSSSPAPASHSPTASPERTYCSTPNRW